MGEHSSIVGGSSAERVINCPGSVLLSQTVPRQESSEFAIRGSMLHKCMEFMLADADAVLEDIEGMFYDAEKDELTHQRTAYEVTADLIEAKVEPALEWFECKLDPDEFWIEQKVSFDDDIPGAFGTADIIYKKGKTGGIVDWKFGDGVKVFASNNSQMKFYICGARTAGFLEGMNTIRAHIYQPSGLLHPDEYHTQADYTTLQLNQFEASLAAAVAAASSPDAPLSPGDWCRWCPVNGAGQCPLLNSMIGTGVVKAPPQSMTPVQLSELLELAELAEPWAKNVKKLAAESAQNGYPPPGWKLVQSLGNRRFVDEKKAANMLKNCGVAAAEIHVKKLVSPAQADKLIKSASKPVSRNWGKNIERPERGLALVRESDKREAVVPTKSLQKVAEYLKVANLSRGK